MTLSVDDMLRLTEGMASKGVAAFEAGDFKVSFFHQSPAAVPMDPLTEIGDESDDDLFFSSPIGKRGA